MPIYAYRCESCGFEKDALQKLSDAPLTVCPSCGESKLRKQVTAAGFQLKGSGWYVTDFRGGSKGAASEASEKDGVDKTETGTVHPEGAKGTEGKGDTKGEETSAKSAAPSAGATPASGTGGGASTPTASGISAAS